MFGKWLIVVFAALSLTAFVLSELSRRVFSYTSDGYVTTDVIFIAPVVRGRLVDVAVGDNAAVEEGDLIAQVDPVPYRLAHEGAKAALELAKRELTAAEDEVNSTRAAVDAADAALKNAQQTFDRIQTLTEEGVTTQQRLDDETETLASAKAAFTEASTALVVAEDNVKTREAGVRQAEVDRDKAAYDLEMSTIVAPTSGRIAPFQTRTGAFATIGDPLVALVSDENWRIIVNLPEQNLAHLAVGQRAWVMVASSPWRLVPGRVKSIAPGVARAQRDPGPLPYVPIDTDWVRLSQRFPVEIVLDEPVPIPLYRGTDVRVVISHTAPIAIPLGAPDFAQPPAPTGAAVTAGDLSPVPSTQ